MPSGFSARLAYGTCFLASASLAIITMVNQSAGQDRLADVGTVR